MSPLEEQIAAEGLCLFEFDRHLEDDLIEVSHMEEISKVASSNSTPGFLGLFPSTKDQGMGLDFRHAMSNGNVPIKKSPKEKSIGKLLICARGRIYYF